MAFVRGGDGKSVYDAFLANATQKWPGYVSELKGVSAGSGQPFDAVFTMNMRQEIGYFVPALAGHTWIGHCSDVVVVVAGNGGEGGGEKKRGPQLSQSVPYSQSLNSAPSPPSLQAES